MNSNQPTNQSRRRLAKGAFGSSVVLASLTTKNAFATSELCRLSGQLSGASGQGRSNGQVQDCSTAGYSHTTWKGKYPKNAKNAMPPSFLAGFYGASEKDDAKRAVTMPLGKAAKGWAPATVHQLLWGTSTPADPALTLGAQTLVIYLNATKTGGYPIDGKACEDLYLHATGQESWKRGGEKWTAADSKKYLESLYRAI